MTVREICSVLDIGDGIARRVAARAGGGDRPVERESHARRRGGVAERVRAFPL